MERTILFVKIYREGKFFNKYIQRGENRLQKYIERRKVGAKIYRQENILSKIYREEKIFCKNIYRGDISRQDLEGGWDAGVIPRDNDCDNDNNVWKYMLTMDFSLCILFVQLFSNPY